MCQGVGVHLRLCASMGVHAWRTACNAALGGGRGAAGWTWGECRGLDVGQEEGVHGALGCRSL